LDLVVDFQDSTGIRSSRQSIVTHDSIPPRHRQIVFLADFVNETGLTAQLKYTYQTKQTQTRTPSMPAIRNHQTEIHSHRPF
jgi:hypothetical protein